MVTSLGSQFPELESNVYLRVPKGVQEEDLRKGILVTLDCHCMEVYACLFIILIKGMISLSYFKESHAKKNLHIKGQVIVRAFHKLRFKGK